MNARTAKLGAAIAGAVLFAMPVLDVLIGIGNAGAGHLGVGMLGATLIALSGKWQ